MDINDFTDRLNDFDCTYMLEAEAAQLVGVAEALKIDALAMCDAMAEAHKYDSTVKLQLATFFDAFGPCTWSDFAALCVARSEGECLRNSPRVVAAMLERLSPDNPFYHNVIDLAAQRFPFILENNDGYIKALLESNLSTFSMLHVVLNVMRAKTSFPLVHRSNLNGIGQTNLQAVLYTATQYSYAFELIERLPFDFPSELPTGLAIGGFGYTHKEGKTTMVNGRCAINRHHHFLPLLDAIKHIVNLSELHTKYVGTSQCLLANIYAYVQAHPEDFVNQHFERNFWLQKVVEVSTLEYFKAQEIHARADDVVQVLQLCKSVDAAPHVYSQLVHNAVLAKGFGEHPSIDVGDLI